MGRHIHFKNTDQVYNKVSLQHLQNSWHFFFFLIGVYISFMAVGFLLYRYCSDCPKKKKKMNFLIELN